MPVTPSVLEQAKARLKEQGVKGALEVKEDRWIWRGYCSINKGKKAQRPIPLGLPAQDSNVFAAEERVRLVWGRYQAEGTIHRPLPWEIQAIEHKREITVLDATAALKEQFFSKKVVNSTTKASFDRLKNEMRRMAPDATLTMDLMVKAIQSTEPGSRSRSEATKVYKRVAKLVGIEGTDRIDDLRGTYQPKRTMNPPNREKVAHILDVCRFATSRKGGGPMWQGWVLAAIASFGCRPTESFGLKLKGSGHAAHVWTIKRANARLTMRTGMLLHQEWLETYSLMDRPELPYEFIDPLLYDATRAKYFVNQTNRWFQTFFPEHTLYDLRHAWAIDAITELSGNSVLAAKCMGHTHQIHCDIYHQWMQDDDVERAVRDIQQRKQAS